MFLQLAVHNMAVCMQYTTWLCAGSTQHGCVLAVHNMAVCWQYTTWLCACSTQHGCVHAVYRHSFQGVDVVVA